MIQSKTKPVIVYLNEGDVSSPGLHHENAEWIYPSKIDRVLDILTERKVAVLVGCAQMEGKCGVSFIGEVKKISPETLTVLLDSPDNLDLAKSALHQGDVWRWLPKPWSLDDLRQVVSEGVSKWIDNQKTKEIQTVERLDLHLQIIREFTTLLNHHHDMSFVLDETVKIIQDKLNYDVVSIYIWDSMSGLVLRHSVGLHLKRGKQVQLKEGEGLTGVVFKERKSLIVMPASGHPKFKSIPEIGEEIFESYIGVPISMGKTGLGVLVGQKKEKTILSSAQETIFQIIASGLAGILDISKYVGERGQRFSAKMKVFQGKAISPGFAIGPAFLIKGLFQQSFHEDYQSMGEKQELQRLKLAFKLVEKEQKKWISELEEKIVLPKNEIRIYKAHLFMVQDSQVFQRVAIHLKKDEVCAESAVIKGFEEIAAELESQFARYFKERAMDFRDIGEKVLRALVRTRGSESEQQFNLEGKIIVASEITPSWLITMHSGRVGGLVSESGGETSHAAILAKSLGIPAVFGVEGIFGTLDPDVPVLVDGKAGMVYSYPDEFLIKEHKRQAAKQASLHRAIEEEIRDVPFEGYPVQLHANVGYPGDLELASKFGVENAGLFRTEFQFIQYERWPSLLEQFKSYENAAKSFKGYVTVRTLDVGGDKKLPYLDFPKEENPMLGFRSIRFSMEYLDHFKTQLRAILLAYRKGNRFRILLPMVSHLWEIETAREIVFQLCAELDLPPFPKPEIGIMIEVPAVVSQLEDFGPFIDFATVGTNDLIQYLLAVDRTSSMVRHLYTAFHPSVIRTLAEIENRCTKMNLEVSVCGEMAGTPSGALALIALGYRQLSVHPNQVPLLRFLMLCLMRDSSLDFKSLELKKNLLTMRRHGDIESHLSKVLDSLDPRFSDMG